MPVIPWTDTFSDAKPDPISKLFFDGTTKQTFTLARNPTSHSSPAPRVTIAILKTGTSTPESYELTEGDTQVVEGVQCTGFAVASGRQPGETVSIDVSVTW
jgi:hypothetical protein